MLKPIEPNVQKGQRFILKKEKRTHGLTSWRAPYTGDFECVIPAGTLIEALHDSVPTAEGFSCKPVEYAKFEIEHVPESDRTSPKYGGYYLVLMKNEIRNLLKAVGNQKKQAL